MKEMTLEEVKIYVLEHFCEYLPECYQKSTLRVESVVKNNQRINRDQFSRGKNFSDYLFGKYL